jgi:hypothetical protein
MSPSNTLRQNFIYTEGLNNKYGANKMRNIYLKNVGITFSFREAGKPICNALNVSHYLVQSVILLNRMQAKNRKIF